jgi:choice-of-anchor B domain-containing protein
MTVIESQTFPSDYLGYRVALDGNRMALGAVLADDRLGAVSIYEVDEGSSDWLETARLSVAGSYLFGWDVDLDGNRLLVGERLDGGSGYVFEFDATSQQWSPVHSWGFWAGGFGLSGNTVIAGHQPSGTASIFAERQDGSWGEAQVLSGNPAGNFGSDADISGNYAIVGEPNRSRSDAGKAFIYERDARGVWTLVSETVGENYVFPSVTGGKVACTDGTASIFDCSEVDLVAFLNIDDLLGTGESLADVWGWTDPTNGREYAIVTRTRGTTFVDISDPENPVVLGVLPIHEGSSPNSWHDVKVYKNHAFLVADNAGPAGMQVFDLTELRNVSGEPVIFEETAHYSGIGSVHNLAINEVTGFAYLVGATDTDAGCGGGLHVVDVNTPSQPTFVSCYADESTGRSQTGYTHDAQCVIYHGPDTDYEQQEICFGSNETAIQITNVEDKSAVFTIATATYPTASYIHQGWLTEDHRYFIQDDELDERDGLVSGPTTYVWDVTDLDDPVLATTYVADVTSADHNQYVKDGLLYQANYGTGLRILDVTEPTDPTEVAFFDTSPATYSLAFQGAWTAYPFFNSGNVVVSSMREGLFILRMTDQVGVAVEGSSGVPNEFSLSQNFPNPFNPSTRIGFALPQTGQVRLSVIDALGRTVADLVDDELGAGTYSVVWDASGFASGLYYYRLESGSFVETRSMSLSK